MGLVGYVSIIPPGAEGYVVPWAMVLAPSGNYFIHKSYNVYDDVVSTATMRVIRDRDGEYIVDISRVQRDFYEESAPYPSTSWIKVKDVLTEPPLEVNATIPTNIQSRKIRF